MHAIGKILVLVGLAALLASCEGKDLSEEKSRSSEQFDELQERMLRVQTDR